MVSRINLKEFIKREFFNAGSNPAVIKKMGYLCGFKSYGHEKRVCLSWVQILLSSCLSGLRGACLVRLMYVFWYSNNGLIMSRQETKSYDNPFDS